MIGKRLQLATLAPKITFGHIGLVRLEQYGRVPLSIVYQIGPLISLSGISLMVLDGNDSNRACVVRLGGLLEKGWSTPHRTSQFLRDSSGED